NDKEPPYSIDDIISYYQELGFSQGVALDHLVFPKMDTAERERRQAITLDNAKAFLHQHQAQGCKFQPVAIVQGWDAASRKAAMQTLVDLNYEYFALGGMARTRSNKEIVGTLEAINSILPKNAKLHVFGLARQSLLKDFKRLGVTSIDSASPIRRAFLGTGEDNFWTKDGTRYAAIRIPQAKQNARKKRSIDSTEEVMKTQQLSFEAVQAMEQAALSAIRSYAKGDALLEDALAIILAYDKLHGKNRNHRAKYKRTLEARPWDDPDCAICQQDKVEVIIFRGNNRNRRRGFHNAWAYYQQFKAIVSDE
ncbi:MAG: tRNA-guanine transglycosylase DpdA, partial [Candidatus Promineifilaceae bacterium]